MGIRCYFFIQYKLYYQLMRKNSCCRTKTRPGSYYWVCISYSWIYPSWHMLKYLLSLPAGNGAKAFVIATRGSLRVFGRNLPGISGSLTFLAALILLIKRWKVVGLESINMPSNWYSLHPPQSRKSHENIITRSETKVEYFVQKLINGKKVFFSLNNLYEFFWAFVLLPISILYLLVGRFFLAKLFFANSRCDSCGACAENCPISAIQIIKGRPYWKYNCESCMRCAAICPKNAVEAGHSLGVILYFICSIPISTWLFSLPGGTLVSLDFHGSITGQIINTLYFYPAVFFTYFIFTKLIRIKIVNKFFTYTTFTHIWGRYFLPGLKKGSLNKK